MAYSELIKNFEKIRGYIREFYVYGFKKRSEYNKKSSRSYDDEKRRIESWLGDYMRFVRTADGKNAFISIDSHTSNHNPLYNAFKAKSFTDYDITIHFILFDILNDCNKAFSLPELIQIINDKYLSYFENPLIFDESTLRKKIKEYINEGLIISQKQGKHLVYKKAKDISIENSYDAINFYSEIAPCGVIGSFLLDKFQTNKDIFTFKHHYITSAIDSDIVFTLFYAMQTKSAIYFDNLSRKSNEPKINYVVPLRIYISVQNGKQNLIAYNLDKNNIQTYRIDYISNIKLQQTAPMFDDLRKKLDDIEKNMWGVTYKENLERVEFWIQVKENEDYIVKRLEREKRTGIVEKIDNTTYHFVADVYDTLELVPWIRTFICRIIKIDFSNKKIEKKFKKDIKTMLKMYDIYD